MADGFCIWLTGLSGSGKTTTASQLAAALAAEGRASVVFDGDEVRRTYSPQLGYSRADREANALHIGRLAADVVAAGTVAICAVVSPFASSRDAVRAQIGTDRFIEVYVDTPLEVCQVRDPKGLYARARRGEVQSVSGLDAPYEPPSAPELVLDTTTTSVDDNIARVLAYLRSRALLTPPPHHDA